MELRNITESILIDFIDNLDDVKNNQINKNQKVELIAYTLNRLKPNYVTSNKGFLNHLVKFKNDPQYFADMMVQVSNGLKLVKQKDTSNDQSEKSDFQLLRNITEYIVVEMVDSFENIMDNQKFELFAYVLNRLNPLYITSDNKFPEIMSKWKNDSEFIKEVKTKIKEGLIAVSKLSPAKEKEERLDLTVPYYGFPKILGKIISSVSFMYLESGTITLLINSQATPSRFSDMNNPLEMTPEDKGIFSFAPKPIRAEKVLDKKQFIITLIIQQGDNKYEKIIPYEVESELGDNLHMHFDENIIQIDDIYVPF